MWILFVLVVLNGEPEVLQYQHTFNTEAACIAYADEMKAGTAKSMPPGEVKMTKCVVDPRST